MEITIKCKSAYFNNISDDNQILMVIKVNDVKQVIEQFSADDVLKNIPENDIKTYYDKITDNEI